jgi:hypothetical protein
LREATSFKSISGLLTLIVEELRKWELHIVKMKTLQYVKRDAWGDAIQATRGPLRHLGGTPCRWAKLICHSVRRLSKVILSMNVSNISALSISA